MSQAAQQQLQIPPHVQAFQQRVNKQIKHADDVFIEQYLQKQIKLNGKDIVPTRNLFNIPKNDEYLITLQQQFKTCTESSVWGLKYSFAGAALSIPASYFLKTYWPLFFFFASGSALDFYFAQSQCGTVREDIDEYMLLKAKVIMQKQKHLLEKEIAMWKEFDPASAQHLYNDDESTTQSSSRKKQ